MDRKIFIEPPEITQEDFLSFLAAKTSTGTCAACGKGDFSVVSNPAPRILADDGGKEVVDADTVELAAIFTAPILGVDASYITAAVSCKNCGWVRHHSVGEIIHFIDGKSDPE